MKRPSGRSYLIIVRDMNMLSLALKTADDFYIKRRESLKKTEIGSMLLLDAVTLIQNQAMYAIVREEFRFMFLDIPKK